MCIRDRRKTSRLVEELRQAAWQPSPKTDGDAECEFRYQPDVSVAPRKGAILAPHPFAHLSLLTDHLRTVLAVKGSLRRAQQRLSLIHI